MSGQTFNGEFLSRIVNYLKKHENCSIESINYAQSNVSAVLKDEYGTLYEVSVTTLKPITEPIPYTDR